MSLILDALNRAEHERKNQNSVPDLNSLHSSPVFNAAPDKQRTLWWVMGVVALLVVIIIMLVMMLRREPVAQPSVAQIAPPPQPAAIASPAPVVEQKAPVVAAETAAKKAVVEPTSNTAAVKATAQPAASNVAIDQLYSAEDPVAADTGVTELYAAEAATAAASETIVDPFNGAGNAAALSAVAQEQAPPRTFDSIKNIPDFNSLPWNMRQQIPTITYARHNFLADGVSSVVINNQTTGVGNIIGTGQFVVQEIFLDGVVLKHGNAVFKMRALNGWINM